MFAETPNDVAAEFLHSTRTVAAPTVFGMVHW